MELKYWEPSSLSPWAFICSYMKMPVFRRLLIAVSCCGSFVYAAGAQVSVKPASLSYGSQYLNKSYPGGTINITNTGSVNVSVSSFTVTGPFQWTDGLAPQKIDPGVAAPFSFRFWPTAAGAATGSVVLNFTSGVPSVTVPLSGTGLTTKAALSYSATEVVFPPQTVGSSASQNLTLTNSGTNSLTLDILIVTPSVFSATTPKLPYTLTPGQSTTVAVTYAPVSAGTQLGSLSFTINNLPESGVGLNGTANPAVALTLATTSPLTGPATAGALYNYQLNAAGGTPPYTWSLIGGALPSGLTLNAQGLISGTAAKSAKTATFQVQVADAASNIAAGSINLGVDSATGGLCNNISSDITGTTMPEIPMDQLGTGTYLGAVGGLYPGGSNTIPAAHLASGITIANTIQPLDSNGNPSPTGKYALLSLGTSEANYEFNRFLQYASNEPTINPNLVLVQGAMGAEALDTILGVDGIDFWNNIYNWELPDAGVTPQQVEIVWLEPEDAHPPGLFPQDSNQIQNELLTFIPNLLVRFPNLKLLYLASRAYAGYANPPIMTSEPYAYDQGYALQAVIADQINGDPALNFDPTMGPVLAPWISWESYKWGNGLSEHNGMVWSCQDFRSDGYHVDLSGEDKVSGLLMNFLKSDPTAAPWFYVPSQAAKR